MWETKMDRAVALRKIERLVGQKIGYRIDAKAPKQEERDEARAALTPAIEKRNALRDAREARKMAVLEADAEYQRLKAEAQAATEATNKLSSITRHYKITVGSSVMGLFFSVHAEGDTWEEIIAKLTAGKKIAA
jgi:chromosome segregation ATPase